MFALFIILVVLTLIALGVVPFAKSLGVSRWVPGGFSIGFGILAFFSLLGATYNSVAAQETAVPITFGHTGSEIGSGVHFLNPFTTLVRYPTTQQDYRMAAAANEGAKGAANDAVSFTGSDNGQLSADVDVYYTIPNATLAYHKLGNQTRIDDVFIRGEVRAAINQEANQFSSDVLLHNIAAIEPAVVKDLQASFQANGLDLNSVVIRTPIPGDNLKAKLAAQQNIQTEQANLDAAKIAAQTAVVQAQGQADAAKVLGQAIEQFPNVTCNTFVQGLIDGKITGPVYVAPGCSATPGVTPLVQSK
jgi:regulator of protease activity HflC (stomatin/prohibitin superfamily)